MKQPKLVHIFQAAQRMPRSRAVEQCIISLPEIRKNYSLLPLLKLQMLSLPGSVYGLALAAVLVWALHAKLKVLFFLCLVMSLVTFWTYQAGRMGYRKSWTQFREGNRPDGTVTFTASGIREWNASDHTERFTWEQWDCCIISQEVIVLTFHQPMLVLLPYTQESESTVVQALNAFGKQDTIYKV